jgi:hypothetical protein
VEVVDFIFVTDGGECCFFINKTINMIPTDNRVINDAKIIRIITIMLHRFDCLSIGVGSTTKRQVESSSLSKSASGELTIDD